MQAKLNSQKSSNLVAINPLISLQIHTHQNYKKK